MEEIKGFSPQRARILGLVDEVDLSSFNNCPAMEVFYEPENYLSLKHFAWKKHILKKMDDYRPSFQQKIGALPKNKYGQITERLINDSTVGRSQLFTLLNAPEAFRNLGREKVIITADALACTGCLPCAIGYNLKIKNLDERNFILAQEMLESYKQAIAESKLTNFFSQVSLDAKNFLTAFCADEDRHSQLILDWNTTGVGLASDRLRLKPQDIKAGMPIVAFCDHSGSRIDQVQFLAFLMQNEYGVNARAMINNPEALEFARKLTAPVKSYARTICRLIGWQEDGRVGKPQADILGIARIGGGIWKGLGDLLPFGIGAELNAMPDPPAVQLQAQEMSWRYPHLKLTDDAAIDMFNSGLGVLLVVKDQEAVYKVVGAAQQDGISTLLVGYTKKSGSLIINSEFKEKKTLTRKIIRN